jgi:hypothetical protein
LQHGYHFVLGFEHFAALNAFDGEGFEDYAGADWGRGERGGGERGDFAGYDHLADYLVEGFWCAGHFEAYVETFVYAQAVHDV